MELSNEFRVDVPVGDAWAVLTDVERIAPCMPGAQLEEIEGDEYRGNVKVKVGPITAQYKGKATFLSKDDANHVAVLKAEGRDTKGQGNASANITATLVPDGTGTKVTVVTDLTVTGRVAQFGRGVMADVSSKLLGQFVQCLETNLLANPEQVAGDIAAASAAAAAASTAAAGGAASAGASLLGTATQELKKGEAGSAVAGSNGAGSAATVVTSTVTAASPAAGSAASSSSAGAASSAGSGASEPTKPSVRKIDMKAAEPVDLLETAGAPVAKRAAPLVAVLFLLMWLLRRRKRG